MEYENMKVLELKSLARDRGLRNYSQMRKTELVTIQGPPGTHRMLSKFLSNFLSKMDYF